METTYYKLGPKASSFHCHVANLTIANKHIKPYVGKTSQAMKTAIANGHIIEVEEDEYNRYLKGSTTSAASSSEELTTPNFDKLSKADIIGWAEEHIEEFKAEDVKGFSKVDLISHVEDLLNPEEDEDEEDEDEDDDE